MTMISTTNFPSDQDVLWGAKRQKWTSLICLQEDWAGNIHLPFSSAVKVLEIITIFHAHLMHIRFLKSEYYIYILMEKLW